MESKKVVTSGPVIPSTVNTPLDFRTRVNTVDEIYNIELPFVGMIVYVIDEDKYYKIKTLKSKEIGSRVIEDAAVDTFEKFLTTEDIVIVLQQEITELRAIIDELRVVPPENYSPSVISDFKYVIANENRASEMAYMQTMVTSADPYVVGFIINPKLYKEEKSYDSGDYFDVYNNYYLDFEIKLENNTGWDNTTFGNTIKRISGYKKIIIYIYSLSLEVDFTIDITSHFSEASNGSRTIKINKYYNELTQNHIKLKQDLKTIFDAYKNDEELLINFDIILEPYVSYTDSLEGYYREIELQKHSTYLNFK